MKTQLFRGAFLVAATCAVSFGASFVNGDFETGDSSGWTVGGGFRGNILNSALLPSNFLPGGANYNAGIATSHSSIVTAGTDPNTGNALNRVYSGTYSWRVEDTTTGGYASVISQTVNNYTDPEVFFAWAAVLEGAHGSNDAATIRITLRDLTDGIDLIVRQYNAASSGSGVDPRFNYHSPTNHYWTPWQIEQLTLPTSAIGHNLILTVLAADCEPTGHEGYLYLDGFGSVAPTGTPEPATYAMVAAGLAVAIRRRIQQNKAK